MRIQRFKLLAQARGFAGDAPDVGGEAVEFIDRRANPGGLIGNPP